MANWFLHLLVFSICINITYGSHFEAGSITYKVIGNNGSKLIVSITQSYTYVYPKIYCNNTLIASQQTLALAPYADATATLNCIASCGTSGGYTPIPVAIKCTDYSVGMSITVGQRTDNVAIDNGSYFEVAYQGSAWRALSLPSSSVGTSQNWSISAIINLIMQPDGTYNTPPVATMISPIYIPVGIQQQISIPTIDADNNDVRCRFANGSAECSSVCPPASLPSGTTISSDCTLTITGAVAGDWYAVAIQVFYINYLIQFFLKSDKLRLLSLSLNNLFFMNSDKDAFYDICSIDFPNHSANIRFLYKIGLLSYCE
jgi:hypothetical protein